MVYEIRNENNFIWLIKCFLFKVYFHLSFAMSLWEIIMLKALEFQKEVKNCGRLLSRILKMKCNSDSLQSDHRIHSLNHVILSVCEWCSFWLLPTLKFLRILSFFFFFPHLVLFSFLNIIHEYPCFSYKIVFTEKISKLSSFSLCGIVFVFLVWLLFALKC